MIEFHEKTHEDKDGVEIRTKMPTNSALNNQCFSCANCLTLAQNFHQKVLIPYRLRRAAGLAGHVQHQPNYSDCGTNNGEAQRAR